MFQISQRYQPYSISHTFITTFFTNMPGSTWMPDSQSGRFIVGFWWMYCIVVMATYSGNLIAYLTVTKTTLPFDSLDDMINQNKFKFGTLGGTITEYKLQVSY